MGPRGLLSLLAGAGAALPALIFLAVPHGLSDDCFVQLYQAHARGPLFTGFISLGGFLFAMLSFTIVNMYDRHYVHEASVHRYVSELGGSKPDAYLEPLANTRLVLSWTVAACFACAASQMTLGFASNVYAALAACCIACSAAAMLFTSVVIVWTNLARLIDTWKEDCRTRIEAALKASSDE